MGLAPSGNDENLGKSAVAKVPVPIFSQPLRELSLRKLEIYAMCSGRTLGTTGQRQPTGSRLVHPGLVAVVFAFAVPGHQRFPIPLLLSAP